MRQIIFLVQLDLYRALPRHERGRMPGVPRLCNMSLSSAPGFCISWLMGSPLYFSSLLMVEAERSCQQCIFRAPENVKEICNCAAQFRVVACFVFSRLNRIERHARWLTCRQLIIAAWSHVQIKSSHHLYLQPRRGRMAERQVDADDMLTH